MVILIVIGVIFISTQIFSIIRNIQEKNKVDIKVDILNTLFLLIFLVFLFSACLLGGTAYNNASIEYDLYEKGRYYLENRNEYKEVTHSIFIYMKIIEPIGILSFLIVLLINIYMIIKNKKSLNTN